MQIVWRLGATVALALGITGCALFLFANAPNGTFGVTLIPVLNAPVLRVAGVDEGGPAARAGIKAGDILGYPPGPVDRSVMMLLDNGSLVAIGDTIAVGVSRGQTHVTVQLSAVKNSVAPPYEAAYFCALAVPLLLLGWLVVWKRPYSGDAVTLGCVLLALGLWNSIPERVGPVALRFEIGTLFASFCYIVGRLGAAIFFARYSEGAGTKQSALRRTLLYMALAAAASGTIVMLLSYLAPLYGGTNGRFSLAALGIVAISPIVIIISFIDAYRKANPASRVRLRWIGGSYFAGFAGPELIPAASIILTSRFSLLDQVLLESTLFIFAIGITYAVLRRHVVDVSVVVNRALVFSVLSAVIVATFIALEWLAGMIFLHMSRSTSLLIEVLIAVGIGLTLRPLHNRVDYLIDAVFFAKRHRAERALHHLATEVSFIRNRETLLARVERDLLEHLDVRTASIYARDDVRRDFELLKGSDGAPEFIDADDDAAVALAVNEAPLYLQSRRTAIQGALVVPLSVRKVLTGFIVVGPKPGDEAFAADEIEALRFLAGYLSPALLSAARDADGATTESLLRQILSELRALGARLSHDE
ncbi:MAG: GAF domain-containing protein [Candidatus Baltobacteraceae bacterium]